MTPRACDCQLYILAAQAPRPGQVSRVPVGKAGARLLLEIAQAANLLLHRNKVRRMLKLDFRMINIFVVQTESFVKLSSPIPPHLSLLLHICWECFQPLRFENKKSGSRCRISLTQSSHSFFTSFPNWPRPLFERQDLFLSFPKSHCYSYESGQLVLARSFHSFRKTSIFPTYLKIVQRMNILNAI